MPQLKIATWNVEWMISIFGGASTGWDGTIPNSFPGKMLGTIRLEPIADVPGLCRRIAGVIKTVNPDIIGLQEGPPLKAQLELFVKQFLDDAYVVFESNPRSQSVCALVKRALANRVVQEPFNGPTLKLLNAPFFYYPWIGFKAEDRQQHSFYRIPLVLKFRPAPGRELQIVVVHTKSKFSLLKTKKQWEQRDRTAVLDALDARQKLSAEAGQLRRYVDEQLAVPDRQRALLVMGDMNDGPFAELMETEFLLSNIIDEMVGSFLRPGSLLSHAMTPQVLETARTVRFSDPLEGGAIVEELIDHMLVSPSFRQVRGAFKLKANSCQVEMAAYAKFDEDTGHSKRGLRPSDHRPVSAVISY